MSAPHAAATADPAAIAVTLASGVNIAGGIVVPVDPAEYDVPLSMLELFGDPDDPEDQRIIPPQPGQLPLPEARVRRNSLSLSQPAATVLPLHNADGGALAPMTAENAWQTAGIPTTLNNQQPQLQSLQADQQHCIVCVHPEPEKPAAAVGNGHHMLPALSSFNSYASPDEHDPDAAAAAAALAAAAADDAEESSKPATSNKIGIRIVVISSAIMAALICAGGAYMLAHDSQALLNKDEQCDQLYVWSMLFIIFEGTYLIFLTLHAFHCREANLHAKRAKTSMLFIVLLISIGLWLWGTIIINVCTCPEAEHKTMWTFFRVLYWLIVGIWSLVLCALTAPVGLFLAFKWWADRNG